MPDPAARQRPAFTSADPSAAAVRQLIEIVDPASRGASLTIDGDDDMFTFTQGVVGTWTTAAMGYVREGLAIAGVVERVAEWRFGGLDRVGSLLDFAAGYGRSTRFLVKRLPADRVTVSEIQADALEFQQRELGVKTLLSTSDPAELAAPDTYDLVFVASLFTHLPDRTFGAWLAKLWTLVAPGGVLVFSVHDEAINRGGVALEDGFAFIPMSEVASLSVDDYGTTFTTAGYVQRRLEEAIGAEAGDAIRLPRALCFEQDVWVVPRGGPPPGPLDYECGPIAVMDRFDVRGRTLELSGWAADRGAAALGAPSHEIAGVEVLVNGRAPAEATVDWAVRHDVAAHLGDPDDPRFQRSGWSLRGRTSHRLRLDDVVSVVVTCDHGARFVIDSSRVDDLLERMSLPPSTSRVARYAIAARYFLRRGGLRAVAARVPTVLARDVRPLLSGPVLDRARRRFR